MPEATSEIEPVPSHDPFEPTVDVNVTDSDPHVVVADLLLVSPAYEAVQFHMPAVFVTEDEVLVVEYEPLPETVTDWV